MSHHLINPLRRIVLAVVVLAGFVAAPAAAKTEERADGAVIRAWNTVAFDTIRQTSGGDAVAARLYAMVDVAMFDAVNGLDHHPRDFALVPPEKRANGDPVAAAATAAHDVLVALYPARGALYDAELANDLATVRSGPASRKGQAWGSQVAAAVVSARSSDGSVGSDIQPAGSGPGHFRTPWDARLPAPGAVRHRRLAALRRSRYTPSRQRRVRNRLQ